MLRLLFAFSGCCPLLADRTNLAIQKHESFTSFTVGASGQLALPNKDLSEFQEKCERHDGILDPGKEPLCLCKKEATCVVSVNKQAVIGCGPDHQNLKSYTIDDCVTRKSGRLRCPACIVDFCQGQEIVEYKGRYLCRPKPHELCNVFNAEIAPVRVGHGLQSFSCSCTLEGKPMCFNLEDEPGCGTNGREKDVFSSTECVFDDDLFAWKCPSCDESDCTEEEEVVFSKGKWVCESYQDVERSRWVRPDFSSACTAAGEGRIPGIVDGDTCRCTSQSLDEEPANVCHRQRGGVGCGCVQPPSGEGCVRPPIVHDAYTKAECWPAENGLVCPSCRPNPCPKLGDGWRLAIQMAELICTNVT